MKLKIAVLFLIPVLIMAVELNEGKHIWTHDEGFFTQYREIWVRALDVDGNVVIWGKEIELSDRDLIFDPYNHSLVAAFNDFDPTLQEHMNAENLFVKDALSSDWGEYGTSVIGNNVNSFSYHRKTATSVELLAGTPNGVYKSPNGGGTWTGISPPLSYYIYDVVGSPVNQTGLPFNMTYFASTPSGVFMKGGWPADIWISLPANVEEQDFEDADPTNLDSFPEGWTQSGVEDEYRYVRLDTLNTYSGDYSLLIYSDAVGGDDVAARYAMPDIDYVVCEFWFGPVFHSGIIEFKNGLGIKIAYRYGEMSYYTPDDGWVDIEESGVAAYMFNKLTVVLDFDNEFGIISTYDSLSGDLASVDTIELYEAEDTIPEVVFSAEVFGSGSGPYWIDDFSAQSLVYSLTPHPDLLEFVYAGTPLGVYSFDVNEWSKSLDVEGEWFRLETDLAGNYIVAATPALVYLSDDQGTNWNNITGNIPSINDIYVDANGVVYAATDSFPYKYDGTWSQMSDGFLDYGVMEMVKACRAITVIEPDTIVVGNNNGIYVSVDGGDNWLENNGGLEPYPIQDTVISMVDAYFEDAVPSDPTTGLLELLIGEIGPIPDVDSDTLLHVVVLEIYEDGPDASRSYFDATNEVPEDENSNGMELIYVDVDYWESDEAGAKNSIARDLTTMIEWNYDPDEDDWIVIGFERYGAYLAELGVGGIDYSGVPFRGNNITFSATSEHQEYLWIQYIREEFEDDILDDLNLAEGRFYDPQSGLYTVRRLQGIEAIDSILVGQTPGNFVDAFIDWAISCYLDDLAFVKNIDIDFATFQFLGSSGGWEESQPYYSALQYRVRDVLNPLIFSGNDNNDFNLHIIEYNGDSAIVTPVANLEFDDPDRNVHRMDIDTDSFDLLVEVISSRGIDPADAFYNFSRDTIVDILDMIGILQAPLADRFIRIFYYTEELRLLDAGVEGVYVMVDDETSELALMTSASSEGYRVYYTDIALPPVDGSVELVFQSEDISGNQHIDTFDIELKSIGTEGGYIAASDNSFRIDIPRDALNKTYHITTCNTGRGYYVGPNMNLNVNAVLTIDVSHMESRDLSIYRKEGDTWVEIQCVRRGDNLEAEIGTLGEFKVMEGDLVTDVPVTLELITNTLTPFDIKYAIPERGNVRIDVYNAIGQRVKTLVNNAMEPGFYTVKWNAQTEYGEIVGNGIYFYRLSAAGEGLTKKIVVVR
ncbi:hypothetical protein KAX08_03210 [candidate division WOR-3 bacterium]|nr:hypothetical protein [candidate division WOR-3 bacterium]